MQSPVTASMYFVALVAPAAINREVNRFKKWMKDQYQCIVALKSPAHITLVKPFWIETNWEEYLLTTLQSCEMNIAPFKVSLNGFSHFGKRVIYVDVEPDPGLNGLKKQVEDHFIRTFGDSLKREQLSFQPHITIANRDLKPGDFNKAWEHFRGMKYEASFMADRISLLKLVDGKWSVLSEKPMKS